MIWFLLAQITAFGLPTMPPPPPPPAIFRSVQQDEPRVLPSHRKGPHEGEEGAKCYKGETQSPGPGRMMYHCECRLLCELEGEELLRREADECETSCGHNQCLCHADAGCTMDMMQEPPK